MKKTVKILSILVFVLFATIGFAQPPDPTEDPNTGGEDELGGTAHLASGGLILLVLGGAYGIGRTYYLTKKHPDNENI